MPDAGDLLCLKNHECGIMKGLARILKHESRHARFQRDRHA